MEEIHTDPKYINQECTHATFRPSLLHPVRWLDLEQDYPLARAIWFEPLSFESWQGFQAEGYQYCAVIEEGRIVSLAAAWSYSETAWEVAAVHTIPAARRQGYGKSVVSFITAHILEMGRLATCLTEAGNLPMQRTAAAWDSTSPRANNDQCPCTFDSHWRPSSWEGKAGPLSKLGAV